MIREYYYVLLIVPQVSNVINDIVVVEKNFPKIAKKKNAKNRQNFVKNDVFAFFGVSAG